MTEIINIPLEEITPHPGNRKIGGFDQEKLDQLAESIRDIGVQQPAIVRINGTAGNYELVAGERRWLASKIAGEQTLPCIIKELSDLEALKIQLVENLQRDDVHPLDEADGFRRLLEAEEYDVATLSAEIGRSKSYVYQRMKLCELITPVREALLAATISAGHALVIARLPEELQQHALDHIEECRDGWNPELTVRELSAYITEELMLSFSSASFSMSDEDLVPAAGPCTMCSKRTGKQPELFAEIQHDNCMDPDCFNAKLDATVLRHRAELVESGDEYIEASSHYGAPKSKTTIAPWEWNECPKKAEGAKRVLIVEGPQRGRLTYGRVSHYAQDEQTEEEKARQDEEQRKARVIKRTNERLWENVRARIETDARSVFVGYLPPITLPFLRILVEAAFGQIWAEHQKYILTLHGWDRQEIETSWGTTQEPTVETLRRHIAELDTGALYPVLMTIILAPSRDPHESVEDSILRRVCLELGIDAAAVEREVCATESGCPIGG